MRGSVASVPRDRESDEELPDVTAGVAAVNLEDGPGATPVPTVAMDVDSEPADAPPANYRLVDLTEPAAPYIGDPMAPLGELGLSADPT
eukprot:13031082-Alexandrium_andersonii.AAC.1